MKPLSDNLATKSTFLFAHPDCGAAQVDRILDFGVKRSLDANATRRDLPACLLLSSYFASLSLRLIYFSYHLFKLILREHCHAQGVGLLQLAAGLLAGHEEISARGNARSGVAAVPGD